MYIEYKIYNRYCQGTFRMIGIIDRPSGRSRVTMNYECCSHFLIVHIAQRYPFLF